MSLSVKIDLGSKSRVYRFDAGMSIKDALSEIQDNTGEGDDSFGLFQKKKANMKASRWLAKDKTFQYYNIKNGDMLEYRTRSRPVKVKLADGTTKTIMIDDSALVEDIIAIIGSRVGLIQSEEYGLKASEKSKKWLLPNFTLQDQGVTKDNVLAFEKRFFVDDANVDKSDPTQLHMIYIQARDKILDGTYICNEDDAVQFAALQLQIQSGDIDLKRNTASWVNKENVLPQSMKHNMGGAIITAWKKLAREKEMNAKLKYVQRCRALPTYGVTFFIVREKVPKKRKLQEVMLGITRDSVVRMDVNTKAVLSTRPLKYVKRWAAGKDSFTIDYGVYQNDYYTVQTREAEDISQLLSGYIDILLKRQREGHLAIEEDEGDLAKVEVLGPIAAVANTATITQVGVGRYSPEQLRSLELMPAIQMHGGGDSRLVPGQFEVSDWGDASDAIDKIANVSDPVYADDDEDDPLPVELKDRFVSSAANLGRAVSDIVNGDPCDDPQALVLKMANMMRAAQLSAGATSNHGLMDIAKKVAHAVSDLLKDVHDLEADPTSIELKSNLTRHKRALKAAGDMTAQAISSVLTDNASQQLIREAALQAALAIRDFCDQAGEHPSVSKAENLASMLPERAQNLAPLLVDEKQYDQLMANIEEVKKATQKAFKEVKSDAKKPKALLAKAKDANSALTMLINAASTANAQTAKNEEALQQSALVLNSAMDAIKYSGGDPEIIDNAAKDIRATLPSFIVAVKHVAQANPQDAKTLILQAQNMKQACTEVLKHAKAVRGTGLPDGMTDMLPDLQDLIDSSRAYAEGREDDSDVSLLEAAQGVSNQLTDLLATTREGATDPSVPLLLSTANAFALNPSDSNNQALLSAARSVGDAVKKMLALNQASKFPKEVENLVPHLEALLEAADDHLEGRKMLELDPILACNAATQTLLTTCRDAELGNLLEPLEELEVTTDELAVLAQAGQINGPQADEALEDAANAAQAIKTLLDAARASPLEALMQSLVGMDQATRAILGSDGEKFAVFNTVRGYAKQALASTLSLSNTAAQAVKEVKDPAVAKSLAKQTRKCQDESKKLGKALAMAAQSPEDWDCQVNLVKVARDTAKPMANMVNAARECLPHIQSHATKQTLKYSTGEAGVAITKLVNSCRAAGVLTGEEDVDAANQALRAAELQLENAAGTKGNGAVDLDSELANLMTAVTALSDANGDPTSAAYAAQQLANAAALSGDAAVMQNAKDLMPDLSALIAASKAHAIAETSDTETNLMEAVKLVNTGVKSLLNTGGSEETGPAKNTAAVADDEDLAERVIEDAMRSLVLKPKYKAGGDLVSLAADVDKRSASLQQAVDRVDGMVHNGNPEDLMASIHAAAYSFPAVVNAVNQIAAAVKDPEAQQQIVQGAQVLGGLVGKVLSNASSARVDSRAREAVEEGVDDIEDAVDALQVAVQKATPGLKEMEKAQKLLSDSLSGSSDASGDSNVRQLPPAINRLGDAAVAIIRAARVEPETLGARSVDAAGCISDIIDISKGINPLLSDISSAIPMKSNLAAAISVNDHEVAAAAARDAAVLVSKFMKEVKAVSSASDDNAKAAIRKAAKKMKGAVAKLEDATETSDGDSSLPRAARVLNEVISDIVQACAEGEQANRLMNGCAALSSPIEGMVSTAAELVVSPGNDEQLANLTKDGKRLGAGVKMFRDIVKSLTPGTVECELAVKGISESIQVLDEAAMDAAVGILDVVPQKSHQKAQESMVDVVRELASHIQNSVEQVKAADFDQISACAKLIAESVSNIADSALQVAGTTTNQSVQTNHLNLSKSLADSVHNFMKITSNLTLDNSDAELKKALAASSNNVRQNIQDLVNSLKVGVVGLRACDDAADKIKQCKEGLAKKAKKAKRGNYAKAQKELIESARSLAVDSTQLFHTARTEPQGVGDPSASLAQSVEKMIKGAVAAAASAEDPTVKSLLTVGAADLCEGAMQLVLSAKAVATDPGNEVSLESLNTAFQNLTDRVTGLIRGVKQGATGERDCREAAAAVRKATSDLDAAAVTAATGAYKVHSNQSLDIAQDEIVDAATELKELASRLVESVDQSQTAMGAAAQQLASAFGKLSSNTKLIAGITSNVVVQSDILLGAKSLGSVAAGLIMNSLQAQLKPDDSSIQDSLNSRFVSLQEGIEDWVETINSGVESAAAGVVAASTAQASIEKKLAWLTAEKFRSKGDAKPQDLPKPLRELLACVNDYFVGCTGTDGDEFKENVKQLEKACSNVIKNSGGMLKVSTKPETHKGVKYAVKALMTDTLSLLEHMKKQHKEEDKYQDKLLTLADTITKRVDTVIGAASKVPGGEDLELEESSLENQASLELMSAAKEIEDAAAMLMNVQGDVSVDMDDDLSASILSHAQMIMEATMELLKAAIAAQAELNKTADRSKNAYRDEDFSQGLISSAKLVAMTSRDLVSAANCVVKGELNEDSIVATSRTVGGATARLMAAAKAKLAAGSPIQANLTNAANRITVSTKELAREAEEAIAAAVEEEEITKASKLSAFALKAARLEGTEQVNTLQRQLDNAYRKLKLERKKEYEAAQKKSLASKPKRENKVVKGTKAGTRDRGSARPKK